MQEEFDISIQRKIEQKNNSGYLPEYYETAADFREIPDYYFRIEDDKTILQLQKLYKESQPQDIQYSTGSEKFNQGMNSLKYALDSLVYKKREGSCETHGYYDIGEDEYDHDKAFGQYQLMANQKTMTDEFRNLSLFTPKFVDKKIQQDKPVKALAAKMRKLDINEY